MNLPQLIIQKSTAGVSLSEDSRISLKKKDFVIIYFFNIFKDNIVPPYNGFGDEEDSLSNCTRLIPKQPMKDYFKYIDNDKITLRFLARLNTKVSEDMNRRFLISFFLADDSIQVYEMPNKNSGTI